MSVWPGRIARAGSGIIVLGVVGAVGAAAWLAPVPDAVVVEAATVPVPPGPTTLVCPGPVVLPDAVDDVDPEFNPAPVGSVDSARFAVRGAVGARPLDVRALDSLRGAPELSASIVDPAAAGIVTTVPEGALVARAEPADGVLPRVAAAVSSAVTAGDLRGTAAASCQHPASEVWLVGGGTQLGSTALLTVHNPGVTPAEIRLDLWGPAGAVELGGAARYVVPSGGEVSLRLSAFAPEEARIVVRVTSAGGQIAAHLQVSELDGFVPGGMDLVVPTAPPAQRRVVGTVVVPASEVGGPGAAQLRILAPGSGAGGAGEAGDGGGDVGADGAGDEAAAEVLQPDRFLAGLTLLGPEGPVELPGAESVELVVGEVLDVDLGGLPAGAYAVLVDAERPVLAGVRTERVGTPAQAGDIAPVDIAWTPATAGSADVLVALPAGLSTSVVATAVPPSADQDVDAGEAGGAGTVTGTMRVFDEQGAEILVEEIVVPVGRTLSVPLPEGAAAVDIVSLDADADADADAVADAGGTGRATLSWGVLAETPGPDGTFLSTLTAPVRGAAVDEVVIRQAQRLPLD